MVCTRVVIPVDVVADEMLLAVELEDVLEAVVGLAELIVGELRRPRPPRTREEVRVHVVRAGEVAREQPEHGALERRLVESFVIEAAQLPEDPLAVHVSSFLTPTGRPDRPIRHRRGDKSSGAAKNTERP